MGSKSSDKCPYKRHTRERDTERRRRPCEDGGRDWSDATTSQGMPGATRD